MKRAVRPWNATDTTRTFFPYPEHRCELGIDAKLLLAIVLVRRLSCLTYFGLKWVHCRVDRVGAGAMGDVDDSPCDSDLDPIYYYPKPGASGGQEISYTLFL